ncbi:MAG TPA: lipase maturation factor family protein [Bryobacteraceae bacterium]|nr:lipase maturation factor family protein [Bryobacteraceae bacterium]
MIRTFLRVLGFIYFLAFTSFGVQASGLIGSHGILPFAEALRSFHTSLGAAAYWDLPSVLWIYPSDAALAAVWILGALCALPAIFAYRQRAFLAVCLVLWLSLCSVGQDFLSYQWDILLLEAGFLAIFADDSPVRVWLFRWLIFRLVFFSGIGKLLSGDPSWRGLSALHYHYETQPLPTPLAWYLYQLPLGFQKFSTAFALVAEIAVPFLFFLPGRLRRIGGAITILLQVLILASGNYTYFNFLAIALCFCLFMEPRRAPRGRVHAVVSVALAAFVGIVSGLLFLDLFTIGVPPGGAAVLHFTAPFRIVNSYGLFTVMTVDRPEILVEGSDDGTNWRAYEFWYKPGNVLRPPPVIEPQQPRLDWQMWFAALGTYQENRWFVNFMLRLLQGEPRVLRLLQYNPFPSHPPKYIRARVFLYHFTHFGEKGWWRREYQGQYFPAVSLKQ